MKRQKKEKASLDKFTVKVLKKGHTLVKGGPRTSRGTVTFPGRG